MKKKWNKEIFWSILFEDEFRNLKEWNSEKKKLYDIKDDNVEELFILNGIDIDVKENLKFYDLIEDIF